MLERLNQLHSEGIIHEDINKYNIIITVDGLMFIDLENAVICSSERDDDHAKRMTALKVKESLKPKTSETVLELQERSYRAVRKRPYFYGVTATGPP